MQPVNFRVREFNPRVMLERIGDRGLPTMLFVGRRGSGKSTMARAIMRHFAWLPSAVVFSPTEEANHTWDQHVPPMFVHPEWMPDVAKAIIDRNRHAPAGTKLFPTAVIGEDIMYDKGKFMKDTNARYMLMNGRHIGILLIVIAQYTKQLPPELRSQFDYVFLMDEPVLKNRMRLYDDWIGVIPSFEYFEQIFEKCVASHGCMVVDNTSDSRLPSDHIFFYRAKPYPIPPFHIGSELMWQFATLNAAKEGERTRAAAGIGAGAPAKRPTKHNRVDELPVPVKRGSNAPPIRVIRTRTKS